MSKLESLIEDFGKATLRLKDVLKQEKNEFMRDSAIQRFEFSFDLAWKTIKTFLEEHHNVVCNSPRSCIQEAYHQGLIEYSDFWLEMSKDRNYTVHTYKEVLAEQIYAKLPLALKHFQQLLENLKKALSTTKAK